jgi:hypothetical protein
MKHDLDGKNLSGKRKQPIQPGLGRVEDSFHAQALWLWCGAQQVHTACMHLGQGHDATIHISSMFQTVSQGMLV